MVTMGMGEKHMVQGYCGKRTFAHVKAQVEFGNLNIGAQSRDRKSSNIKATALHADLAECIMVRIDFKKGRIAF